MYGIFRMFSLNLFQFLGEFILSRPKIQMPPTRHRQYSVNESYAMSWSKEIQKFVQAKKEGENPIPQRYDNDIWR